MIVSSDRFRVHLHPHSHTVSFILGQAVHFDVSRAPIVRFQRSTRKVRATSIPCKSRNLEKRQWQTKMFPTFIPSCGPLPFHRFSVKKYVLVNTGGSKCSLHIIFSSFIFIFFNEDAEKCTIFSNVVEVIWSLAGGEVNLQAEKPHFCPLNHSSGSNSTTALGIVVTWGGLMKTHKLFDSLTVLRPCVPCDTRLPGWHKVTSASSHFHRSAAFLKQMSYTAFFVVEWEVEKYYKARNLFLTGVRSMFWWEWK